MRRLLVSLVVLSGFTAPAHADAPAEKSPAVAVSLSVGVTVAAAGTLFVPDDGMRALGVVTIFFGPSIGRWYAGDVSGTGLGLRALGAATAVAALLNDIDRECDSSMEEEGTCTGPNGLTLGLLGAGAALWIGGAVLDTVRGYQAARATQRHGLSVAPTAIVTPSSRVPGIALGGSF